MLQAKMKQVVLAARGEVAALLGEWGQLAAKTDKELARWAEAFGYDSTATSEEDERSLELSPFIRDEYDNFALDEQETRDEVFSGILSDERDPFPSEPNDWTAADAIKAIKETEPWKEQEE